MAVDVVKCKNKAHFDEFLQVPFHLHQHDVHWVPPLRMSVKRTLSKKNPFFKNADINLWIAHSNGKPVGRIAGIINHTHNQFYSANTAFWGFFETDNSDEVSSALFKEFEHWAKQQGIKDVRGPMNPSINYECGLQISAFESHPFIMMPQNPEFYPPLVEKQGYKKLVDLQAWKVEIQDAHMDSKKIQIIKALQKKYAITIRRFDMKHFDEEIKLITTIYNDAWQDNWGYLPLNLEEFKYLAADLKSFIMPNFVYIAEMNGEPCGFSVAIPDLNQIFKHIRNGRLLPFNFLKLLWKLKVKKSINQGRIALLGVLKKYQHIPVGAMLYYEYLEQVKDSVCLRGELSWILEDNVSMQAGLKLINATHYKSYRIYEKHI
jgi:hypothetical protein